MDTLGDADEGDYGDDEPAGTRGRGWSHVTTTESFAVASVVLSVCSFFGGSMFRFLAFLIGSPLSDQRAQYLVVTAPTAFLSGLAVALGLTAGRREPEDRWLAGAAGAGVIVGGVGLVASVLGFVLALTLGETGDVNF